jgi:D-cysteine desulfhydrase family pyridoxal phosphate-dependent enzyme
MIYSRIPLAHLPTRIEHLARLSETLGAPQIYCKRDDQTGLGFGGNKTRKLEYLLGDALQQGARTLVSMGAIQSNHCRQVAAVAARAGLNCILVLSGTPPAIATGNLYLDQLFGAEVVWADRENRQQVLEETVKQAQYEGRAPYMIPYGGSNEVGVMGYYEAMRELREEEQQLGLNFDWIVTASSSGGTQAGMLLGALAWQFTGRILGIAIEGSAEELGAIVHNLVTAAMSANGLDLAYDRHLIHVNDSYTGAGYGVMGKPEIEAIRMFASQEGLLLDPVYTGRAAAGLIDLVRKGYFDKDEKVLFWHTGGTPALFAEPYLSKLQQF